MFLFSATCAQLIYIESYLLLCIYWFYTYLAYDYIYVMLATCFTLRNQVYIYCSAYHVFVIVLEPILRLVVS
jgi:hypothetical protein